MRYLVDGKHYEASLIDDGTLDTVIRINEREFRFSSEYVTRRVNGAIPPAELDRLINEAIDEYIEEAI